MVQEVNTRMIMHHAGFSAWRQSASEEHRGSLRGQFYLRYLRVSNKARHLSLSPDCYSEHSFPFILSRTPTSTWSLHVKQQRNVSCSSKGWRNYLYFNYKVYWIWLTLNTAGCAEALRGFYSLCCCTSVTAYSAAIKDQWTVHILYWFVCWISEWIFRCIYNGLIKAPFDLKNTTITESSVVCIQDQLW